MNKEKITYEELLEIKKNLIKKYGVLRREYYHLYKKTKKDKENTGWLMTWVYALAFEEGRLRGFKDFVSVVYDYLVKKNSKKN